MTSTSVIDAAGSNAHDGLGHGMPAHACDCHMHVFDARYPFATGAQPVPPASLAQYRNVQAQIGTSRTVVVAPSSYGLDNRCTLAALAGLGSQARAVVALAPSPARGELDALHAKGVRGVRLNIARGASTPFHTLRPLAECIAPWGWHVQLMMTPAQLLAHGEELMQFGAALSTRLVIDHMARLPQDGGVSSPAYPVLRRLVDAGNTWIKLSLGSSAQLLGTPQEEVLHAMGRDLVSAASGRLVWGSDWPHVLSTLEGKPQPSDVQMRDVLLAWAPAERDRRAILVDTPAALYDFPTA